VSDLHDRMPVVLAPDGRTLWLDEDAERESVVKLLLTPSLPDVLVAHPVGPLVNSTTHEEPACRQPLAASEPPRGQLSLGIDPPRK
jgi:putative SOS response-associated peptidase YedK